MDVRVGLWRKLSAEELILLNCGVGEDSWESLGLQGDSTSPFLRRSALGFPWREWCCSWNSSTFATSCEELTHWKRLWCWEGLGAGGEGSTEDEMAGWHYWLDGHESEWTLGVGDGQGGLACWDSWGCKESDTTEWLNWTELITVVECLDQMLPMCATLLDNISLLSKVSVQFFSSNSSIWELQECHIQMYTWCRESY